MTYLLATILTLLNTAWLALTLFGLPGNWLMVLGALLVAWWQSGESAATPMFGGHVLLTVVALALLGELCEFLAAVAGSKVAGGTRRGATGALLGAILGAVAGTLLIPLPVIGSLLGTCGGAAAGAWAFELRGGGWRLATRSGVGAGVGRLLGTVAKLAVGVAIWLIVTGAAFWP